MDSALLSRFSRTVETIHAAALQPEAWPHALAEVAALHGAAHALVRDSATCTAANHQLHALITQHLSLALGAALRLRDSEFRLTTSLQALDRLHSAVLLLGRRGNVLFANRNALALLAAGAVQGGLGLRAGNPASDALGWLQTDCASTQAALDAELRTVLASAPNPLCTAQSAQSTQSMQLSNGLVLHAVPLAEQGGSLWCCLLQPGALVFITDPQAVPVIAPALLRRLYGISAAECRVAQELLRGQSLQATAQHLHLGDNTVKTHLRQLFKKTRTSRQQQLMCLLLALAAQY